MFPRTTLSFASLLLITAPLALVGACSTDNGDAIHGPSFGPVPERPDATPDSAVIGEDGGSSEAGDPDADAGNEGGLEGGPSGCTSGTVVVLAGNDAILTGASQVAGGAWTGAAIAGSAALNHPAIVPFGTKGFLALTHGPADALQSLSYDGTSWGTASAVGAATTIGAPGLAVVGTKAESVYLAPGTPSYFFRAENAGASWGVTAEPVMAGAAQSFGRSAGTIAAAGTGFVLAQNGGDNDGLYTQGYDGTTWSVGAPILGAGTDVAAPPTMVAVDGKFDLVLLYADNTTNHVIGFATRDSASKAWSNGTVTQATAQTSAQPQLARTGPTTVVSTFLGNDGRPYTMTGTLGASAITWSTPVPLLADRSTVDSPPAIAKGVCGDDAIVVFAAGGVVKATRLRGATWTVPESVTGASGARVSVSTR